MPARDSFHDTVKQALIADGWTITADPLRVPFLGIDMYIDLGAEKLIAAEKENKRIAVEIKSFRGTSFLAQFHMAVGQFVNYRVALESQEPDRMLYLAVPLDTFTSSFAMPFALAVQQRNEIRLIVFDPEKKAVTQWIE